MYVLPNVIGLVQLIKSRSNRRYHQQSKNPPPNLIVTAIPSRNKMIKNSIFSPLQGYASAPLVMKCIKNPSIILPSWKSSWQFGFVMVRWGEMQLDEENSGVFKVKSHLNWSRSLKPMESLFFIFLMFRPFSWFFEQIKVAAVIVLQLLEN